MSDKIQIRADLLTPKDLRRARDVLGPEVFNGRNPLEIIDDPIDGLTLMIWIMRSRDDPEFSWSDAENVPLGDLDYENDTEPPPTAPPAEPGVNGAKPEHGDSKPKRQKRTPRGGSGTSSASTGTSTSS